MLANHDIAINSILRVDMTSKMINNVKTMKSVKEIRRQNLADLVKKYGSQAALARKIEKGSGYVWQLLQGPDKGGGDIGDKVARDIEKKLGMPMNCMDSPLQQVRKLSIVPYTPIKEIDGEDGVDGDHEAMIEEVEIPLSAGPGCAVDFVETGNFRIPFQKKWLRKWGAKPENVKLFRVDGYSMERLLFDGDRVAVDTANKELKSGHVYAFLLNGETKIKHLFKSHDGGIKIVCENQNKNLFPDEHIPAEEVNDVFIMIGRVIDKSGSGGL